jgi:hypothetical protein
MASLVRRAHEWTSGLDLPTFRDTFVDDNGSVHEPAIDRLAGLGVVTGTGDFSYAPGRGCDATRWRPSSCAAPTTSSRRG